MEKQAQLFAGAFMAPTPTITAVADECVELARRQGVTLTPCLEIDWPYIWKGMADRLEVNERTVGIRFEELGLIDRYVQAETRAGAPASPPPSPASPRPC